MPNTGNPGTSFNTGADDGTNSSSKQFGTNEQANAQIGDTVAEANPGGNVYVDKPGKTGRSTVAAPGVGAVPATDIYKLVWQPNANTPSYTLAFPKGVVVTQAAIDWANNVLGKINNP